MNSFRDRRRRTVSAIPRADIERRVSEAWQVRAPDQLNLLPLQGVSNTDQSRYLNNDDDHCRLRYQLSAHPQLSNAAVSNHLASRQLSSHEPGRGNIQTYAFRMDELRNEGQNSEFYSDFMGFKQSAVEMDLDLPEANEMANEQAKCDSDVIELEEEIIRADLESSKDRTQTTAAPGSNWTFDARPSPSPTPEPEPPEMTESARTERIQETAYQPRSEVTPDYREEPSEEGGVTESDLKSRGDTEPAAIEPETISSEEAQEPISRDETESRPADLVEAPSTETDIDSAIKRETIESTLDLRTWRSQVSTATSEIPAPDLANAREGPNEIRQRGSILRRAREPIRNRIPTDARNAISPPPPIEEQLPPPEPDPVPSATQLVRAKSDRRLPEQSMPDLQVSPRGTQPRVGERPVIEEVEPHPSQAVPAQAISEQDGSSESPDQEQVDRVREQRERQAPADEHEGSGEGITLTDEGPPPRPALPPAAKSIVSSVLARLLANPQAGAERILEDAREAAYPNESLQQIYPDIGTEQLSSLTESITSELHTVAEEAGIAGEELNAAIAARNHQLEQERSQLCSEIDEAKHLERDSLVEAGQEENNLVAGAREAVDQHTEQQLEAANGEADPAVINAKRDRLISNIDRKVGQQRVSYEQAKERRHRQLDSAERDQILAYQATAQRDERAIQDVYRQEHPEEQTLPLNIRLQMIAARGWVDARQRELRRTVIQMKQLAETWVNDYRTEIQEAGTQAHELIQAWADEKLGTQTSWWERLLARFRSWSTQAQAETEAWEAVRAGETRDSILTDFVVVTQFAARAGDNVDLTSETALRGLNEEQRAVVRAYYSNSPDARNPIAAVATGIQVRLSQQRRPQLIERFKTEIESKPDSEWPNVDLLGKAENASFSADAIRNNLYQAMHGGVTGWGTDEERVFNALAGLTPTQAIAVRKCYRDTHHPRDLDEDIREEFSGAEQTRAEALLSGDQTLADVATLREALHGGVTGWGTDEDVIWRVLRNKTEEERQRIIQEYRRQYNIDLNEELKDELSEHDLERAEALVEGDTAGADAIAIDQAMRGGWTGWGTDESAIEAVYTQVRQDVAAYGARQNPPWTTAQVEAEIQRRNLSVENSYNARYGGDWEPGDESALRQAFASELSGPELDLAEALADNDLIRADAARVAAEAQSVFVSDDDVVNGVLRHQYERALEEIRRDEWPEIQRRLDARAQEEGWTPYQRRAEERRLERELEQRAQDRARGYMRQLEDRYGADYPTWHGGGLRTVIELNMSGNEREMARDLLAQGGYLSPAQEIHYAVEGAGTDEGAIRRALTGRSSEEIAAIRAEWNRLHPGESMDDRLESELGGRDEFDTHMLLQGEPEKAEQELAQIRERGNWELENSSGFLAGEQERILRDRMKRMEEQYRVLNDPEAPAAERELAMRRFKQSTGNVSTAVEGYREQMDAAADALATTTAIAVAIIVVIVATALTPVTGGTSAAAGAGILGALGGALSSSIVAATAAVAAGAATIVTKRLMLGGAYSEEDLALDMLVTAVDAFAAAATAGIGAGLLKAARGTNLARMAASSSRMTRVAAHGLAEGAEGLVGSLPAAITGNLLNDQNWEHGDPFTNIMTGITVEAGLGTIVSAGMGGVAGIRQAASPRGRPAGDLYAHRGTPRERLAQWRAHKANHPDADMSSWLREFDEGVTQKLSRDAAADQLQRRLRGELLSGIPPAQRRQFADATVEVLSDADFTRLTRNATAPAVTIVEGGKARVLLRDGIDLHALREEGIHLLQSIDPRTRRAVRSLDESRMVRWDDLSIDEQMRLYRNKVGLEIDAQQRLMRSLDEDLSAMGRETASQRALLTQRDIAEDNLRNLRHRLRELDSIGPKQRRRIAQGFTERPSFLAKEPPRLFSKGEVAKTRSSLTNAIRSEDDVREVRRTLALMGERASKDPSIRPTYRRMIETAERISRVDPIAARQYLDAAREILTISPPRRAARNIAPFLDAAAQMPDPHLFLRQIREVAAETRIRGYKLREFGEAIGRMNLQDASEFVRRLRDATRVSKSDAKALNNSIEALREFARGRRGIPVRLVETIAEELNRTRRWDWGIFRSSLGAKYPNSRGFGALEHIISKRTATGWKAADIGPIRHWSDVLQSLHRELGNVADQKELMDAVDNLLRSLGSGYSSGQYREFRHLIRHRILDFVMAAKPTGLRSSAEQLTILRRFMAEMQNVDSASKGALFTEYRRRLLGPGITRVGDFSAITHLPHKSLKLPNGKTVDGVVDVTRDIGAGRPKRGRYLVDDKAGREAFDQDQAKRYSDLLDAGNLTTTDGNSRGLIYIFEDSQAARDAVVHLRAKKLNPNIFVATFDETSGRLKFIIRDPI